MKKLTGVLLFLQFILVGCTGHFISDRDFRAKVAEDFEARQAILEASDVELSTMDLDMKETEAMMFLYAYMPLGDIVNQTPDFYLDHYRMTMTALAEMPWGDKQLYIIGRRYSLPIRILSETMREAGLMLC